MAESEEDNVRASKSRNALSLRMKSRKRAQTVGEGRESVSGKLLPQGLCSPAPLSSRNAVAALRLLAGAGVEGVRNARPRPGEGSPAGAEDWCGTLLARQLL